MFSGGLLSELVLFHGFFGLATVVFALAIAFFVVSGKGKSEKSFYSIIFFRVSFAVCVVFALVGFWFFRFGLHEWLVFAWIGFLAVQLSVVFLSKGNLKEVTVKMLAVANVLFAVIVALSGIF